MPWLPRRRSDRLEDLSLRQLFRRYRRTDLAYGDGTDPHARAEEADRIAVEALRRDPGDSAMWFDRGLLAKWRRDWDAAQDHSAAALDLTPAGKREGQPAAWNLGIAATARRDWSTARAAWAAFGIDLPGEPDEPIEADLGPAPVRLNPAPRFVGQRQLEIDGRTWDTEVVWGARLDPTRIRLVSVPLPESGHRCGDVVLHDGDPRGTREMNGDEYPVFDEIQLWERSPHPTLSIRVQAADGDVQALLDELDAAGLTAEDWTRQVRVLCRACSEGSPGPHSHPPAEPAGGERRIGVSGEPAQVEALVDSWRRRDDGRDAGELTVELE